MKEEPLRAVSVEELLQAITSKHEQEGLPLALVQGLERTRELAKRFGAHPLVVGGLEVSLALARKAASKPSE